MKISFLLCAIFALGVLEGQKHAAAQTKPTTVPATAPSEADYLPPPEVPLPAGMTPLFDGKTLEGWNQIPPDAWVVKNGALVSLGAGRGVIHTVNSYDHFRIILDIRHISGNKDHPADVLFFCTAPVEGKKPLDALGGIQFQVPNGGRWDYRKGHNNSGKGEFTVIPHPKFDEHQWSRVEIVADAATGTARMAVAQPVGSKAVEVVSFKDATAGQKGPIALQMHNKGLFDEYGNIAIEVNPANDELITVK